MPSTNFPPRTNLSRQVNGVDLMTATHQEVMKVLADREVKRFDFHVMRVNSRTEVDA
jgi:hypothetical protein